MRESSDTIVAIATGPQNGAIGVVRLSGPHCLQVAQKIFRTPQGQVLKALQPRHCHFAQVLDAEGEALDEGLLIYMPGPNSFTGEDCLEFQGHGNTHLLRQVVRSVLACADDTLLIRAAEAGEFTKRAFLNGKMDLAQAEAIHDLVTADSEAALKAHLANLDGALSRRIGVLQEQLKASLALVEASFEFPEEDIQTYDAKDVEHLLEEVEGQLNNLLSAFQNSKLTDKGVRVVLVGEPNVGKSSLLNALLVEDKAIVSDIPGTTRDVIEGSVQWQGLRFHFSDTAGLRETADAIENQGIERSKSTMQKADFVLAITDGTDKTLPVVDHPHVIRVMNKADLWDVKSDERFELVVSAKTGFGIKELKNHLISASGIQNVQNDVHVNERQFGALSSGLKSVQNLRQKSPLAQVETEILAEELRDIVQNLESVTGSITGDDILGEIFQRFCIGK